MFVHSVGACALCVCGSRCLLALSDDCSTIHDRNGGPPIMSWEAVPPGMPTQADGPTGGLFACGQQSQSNCLPAVCLLDGWYCHVQAGCCCHEQAVQRSTIVCYACAPLAGWSPMRHAVTVDGGINTKEGTRSWQVCAAIVIEGRTRTIRRPGSPADHSAHAHCGLVLKPRIQQTQRARAGGGGPALDVAAPSRWTAHAAA